MKNDKAVSPVIGVILMVAITVTLAVVIAAFVFGMAAQIQRTGNTQQAPPAPPLNATITVENVTFTGTFNFGQNSEYLLVSTNGQPYYVDLQTDTPQSLHTYHIVFYIQSNNLQKITQMVETQNYHVLS